MSSSRFALLAFALFTGCKPGIERSRFTFHEAPRAAPPWCQPDSTQEAEWLFWKVRMQRPESGVSTDSGLTVGQMTPRVPNGLALVRLESDCARASAVLDSATFEIPRRQSVYLMRLPGEGYIVYPPGVTAGEFAIRLRLDTLFRPLGSVELW
jgi:hypothetical protein